MDKVTRNGKPIERLGRKTIGPFPLRGGSQFPKGDVIMKKVVFFVLSLMLLTNQTNLIHAADVDKNERLDIITEHVNEGVIGIDYQSNDTKAKKVVIKKGDQKYIYNLLSNDEIINYPLQLGDGEYSINIYENISGTKYKSVEKQSVTVKQTDINNVFLQSILEINWREDDDSIQLANELVMKEEKRQQQLTGNDKYVLSDTEKIDVIYDYVIENIRYDYDKINGLESTYTPDNDATIASKTGICYDYSSLLASMLRSQGIPAKMVKGYAQGSDVYHAWNEIYLSGENRWVVVDPTNDAYREQNGFSYDFEKAASSYTKMKEF